MVPSKVRPQETSPPRERRRSSTICSLPTQLTQILIAALDAFERLLGMVVLNNVVLDSGLVGVRENALPVDHAAAHFGQVDGVAIVLRAARSHLRHRLHV